MVLGVILALLLAAVIVLLVVLITHTRRAGDTLESFDARVDTLESNVRTDVGAIGQSMHTSAKSIEASLHSSVDAIGDSLSNRFDAFDTGVTSRVESMEKKIGADVERMSQAISGDIDRVAGSMAETLSGVERAVASQFKGVERALREEFEQSREEGARHNAELLAQLRTAVKGSSDSMTRALDDIAGALRAFEDAQRTRARVSPLVTGGSVAVAVLALLALLIVLLFSRPDEALGRTAALPPLTEVEVASASPIPPMAERSVPQLPSNMPTPFSESIDPEPPAASEPAADATPNRPAARITAPIVEPTTPTAPELTTEPTRPDGAPNAAVDAPTVAPVPAPEPPDEAPQPADPVRARPTLPPPTTPQPDPQDIGPGWSPSINVQQKPRARFVERTEGIEPFTPRPPAARVASSPVEPTPRPERRDPVMPPAEPPASAPPVAEREPRPEPATVETAAWVWGGFASAEEEASAWTVEQCAHHLDIVTRLSHGDYADEVERTLADLAVVRIGDAVVKSLNQRLTDIQATLIEDRSRLESDSFDKAELQVSLDDAALRLERIDTLIVSFVASLPEDRREPWSSHLEGVRRKHGRVRELSGAITASLDAIAARP